MSRTWRAGSLALAGVALLTIGPAARAGDCCDNWHCPPKFVHCMERPPCPCYKCMCPRPVCNPCQLPHAGYYRTCWQPWPWPPDWSHCPAPPPSVKLPPPLPPLLPGHLTPLPATTPPDLHAPRKVEPTAAVPVSTSAYQVSATLPSGTGTAPPRVSSTIPSGTWTTAPAAPGPLPSGMVSDLPAGASSSTATVRLVR